MKNALAVAASLILVIVAANAQSKKKEPPPPPPKVIYNETVNASKPKEPPVITVTGAIADEFYKRNPTVAEISRKANTITIKNKNGTTEKYNMHNKEEDKSFTAKYGVSPIPPPPPPPKVEVVKFSPPVLIKKELLDDFYKRNPAVDKITSNRNITTLKMKDGTTEKYNMNTKEDSERFKAKYGESPIPTPPPPPPPKKIS